MDFGLQFQSVTEDDGAEPHDEAGNDSPEQGTTPAVEGEDGSNVVTIDFGRKK